MKNITNDLSNEHQNILKFIDVLLAECERLETGHVIDPTFFEKALYFIKNYADRFHHAKEEDILFKIMLENQGGLHCNPIPVMLHEHETGREYVKGLEEGVNECNKVKVLENAKMYGYLLQDHIYKEDNILYPMAEQALSDIQKAMILNMYKEVEESKFPKEIVEEYLTVLNIQATE